MHQITAYIGPARQVVWNTKWSSNLKVLQACIMFMLDFETISPWQPPLSDAVHRAPRLQIKFSMHAHMSSVLADLHPAISVLNPPLAL